VSAFIGAAWPWADVHASVVAEHLAQFCARGENSSRQAATSARMFTVVADADFESGVAS
jgi:hypothetical protein